MQKLQCARERKKERMPCTLGFFIPFAAPQRDFAEFDVPVAELVPGKVIKKVGCTAKVVGIQKAGGFLPLRPASRESSGPPGSRRPVAR